MKSEQKERESMRRKLRKSLSWLLTVSMIFSLVFGAIPTASAVDLQDTEFHIMNWQALKELVREANGVAADEKLTIHSIYVNSTSGTATGGAPKYTNQGDVGARGSNGVLAENETIWKVLNTVPVIDPNSIVSITVHAKTGTGPAGYLGTELDPVTIYIDEDDVILPIEGKLITQIYLTNASLEPIPPEEVSYTIH